jgi:hypothetical protein
MAQALKSDATVLRYYDPINISYNSLLISHCVCPLLFKKQRRIWMDVKHSHTLQFNRAESGCGTLEKSLTCSTQLHDLGAVNPWDTFSSNPCKVTEVIRLWSSWNTKAQFQFFFAWSY